MGTTSRAMETTNAHLYAYLKSDCSHKKTKQQQWTRYPSLVSRSNFGYVMLIRSLLTQASIGRNVVHTIYNYT